MKEYLLSRLTSLPAWLGMAVLLGELILHARDVSTLMLLLAAALIALPEDRIRRQTEEWARQIKTWTEGD